MKYMLLSTVFQLTTYNIEGDYKQFSCKCKNISKATRIVLLMKVIIKQMNIKVTTWLGTYHKNGTPDYGKNISL